MRVTNRLIAVVLAALLAVAGALAAVEVVAARAANRDEPLLIRYDKVATTLRDHSWQDRSVRLVCAGLVLLGLLLLLAGLWWQRKQMPLSTEDDRTRAYTDRATVRRMLKRAAEAVEGVLGARAKVRRRQVTVTIRVRPRPRPAAEVERETSAVIQSTVDRLGLVQRPRTRLKLREKHR